MASRVTSAVMALIAAGLFAAAIFSQHWWSGFPTIEGATRHLQEIHVGPLGSELCNVGGDGTCEAMPIAGTFKGVGFIVTAALGLAVAVLSLLAILALIQSEARRTVAKIGFVAVGASVVVSVTMLVLGPTFDVREVVTVPIGKSIALVGAGGFMAIIAGILARRRPRSIQLRSAPMAAMQFAPGQSPLEMIAGLEYSGLPSSMGPGAHAPGVVQVGFGNPLAVGPGYASPGGFRVDAPSTPAPPIEGVTAPMNIPPPPAPNSASFAVAHNPLAGGPSAPYAAPGNPFGVGGASQSYSVPANPFSTAGSAEAVSVSASELVSRSVSVPARPGPSQPPPRPPGPRSGSTQPPPFPGPISTSPGVGSRPPTGAPPFSGPMAGRPGPSQPPPFGGKPITTSPGVANPDVPLAFPGGPPLVVSNLPRPPAPYSSPPRPFVLPTSAPSTPFGGPLPRPKTPPPARDDDTSQNDLAVGDLTTPSLDVDLPYDADLDAPIPPPGQDSGAAMISTTDAMPPPTFGSAPTITSSQPVVGARTDVMTAQPGPRGARTDVVPTLAGPVSAAMPAVSITMVAVSTAPEELPPPRDSDAQAIGPSPACPQCEAPMAWVEAHLRFYCKSCKMYF